MGVLSQPEVLAGVVRVVWDTPYAAWLSWIALAWLKPQACASCKHWHRRFAHQREPRRRQKCS